MRRFCVSVFVLGARCDGRNALAADLFSVLVALGTMCERGFPGVVREWWRSVLFVLPSLFFVLSGCLRFLVALNSLSVLSPLFHVLQTLNLLS